MRVGLIGTGNLGRALGERLLVAGLPLAVWARRPPAPGALVAAGAVEAASPGELAASVDCVVTCLPRPTDVVQVHTAVLRAARPGLLVVETSTIDPATSRRLAAAAATRGVDYLDAPVSGGPDGARAGQLTIMVGGEAAAFERARPVLAALGARVHHMGPAGAGHLTKLCNQLLAGTAYAAVAEALVLGAKGGLDPARLVEVLATASGRSRALEQMAPRVLARAFAPAFAGELAEKDLACALETAQALGVRLRVGGAAHDVYVEMRRLGLGHLDQAAVILPAERLAGVVVRGPDAA